MEYFCYRCGARIEEGVPFCPKCNAPQIRVQTPEDSTPTPPGATRATPAPGPAAGGTLPLSQSAAGHSHQVEWRRGMRPVAINASLLAISLFVQPVLGLVVAFALGAMSAVFYRRRLDLNSIPPVVGAKLGALTGALGYVGFLLRLAVEFLALHGQNLRAALKQVMEQNAARNPDPSVQKALEVLTTPAGIALVVTLGVALLLLAVLLLAMGGGALGAALSARKSSD